MRKKDRDADKIKIIFDGLKIKIFNKRNDEILQSF